MQLSTQRILATHTGSLPRPQHLIEALQRRDRGEETPPSLDDDIRAAVEEAVTRQVTAGIAVVNDGEMGKIGYSTYVKERLEGFGGSGGLSGRPADLAEFPGYVPHDGAGMDFEMPACVGPVSYRSLDPVRADIANLTAAAASSGVEDMFLTAASPGVIALWLQNRYYNGHEEYLEALVNAMKLEYDEIARSGLVLQLDCPDLAMAAHMGGPPNVEEFRERSRLHVEAINHATRDIPAEQVRMHLCWGNYEGPHNHDIPLRDIFDVVLAAKPAAVSFEAANPRHEHEWLLFEEVKLPDGKVLIPGVIDSTTNYVEHPELVAQRIKRYADLVGRESVIAGTDCGFATFANRTPIHPDITWAKLAALAEGASIASASLW